MRSFVLAAPCATCPFRKDKAFPLRPAAREQIAASLAQGLTFYCHNTVDYDVDDDQEPNVGASQHCAGAAKSLMLSGGTTQMMRISERLGGVRLDELEERGPEVWPLDEWRRLNEEGTELDEYEVETCVNCDPGCLAPVGFLGNSGAVMRGTESADGVCEECGEPLCSNCADDQGLCAMCSEWTDED